ncbi:MAG: hypothetical protein ACLQVL_07250, partial [Terriglobia bacterium]
AKNCPSAANLVSMQQLARKMSLRLHGEHPLQATALDEAAKGVGEKAHALGRSAFGESQWVQYFKTVTCL